MMRVFVVKAFGRFCRKAKLSDELLLRTIATIELGLVGADLGQGLIKQRVAREGQGKSGGYRTLIAVRNLKVLASLWLDLSDEQIQRALTAGDLRELTNE